ncbi:MAG TPA: helicase-associated domain-containing protein, partial [Propionibacteriaceae bacterium]|nr:helicase-associated domain-containing protein [Propionibacteriaceae bacterium]
VILPREVAWYVRGGRFAAEPVPAEAPRIAGGRRDLDVVDQAAAGAAFRLLYDIELAVHAMQARSHRVLRTGGLGSRDTAALARTLGADVATATFLVECAAAADLVGVGADGRLLPTSGYDRWLPREPLQRWRIIIDGWLSVERLPWRSAEDGAHALGPEAATPGASSIRNLIIEIIRTAGAGSTVDLESLATAASWHRPRLRRSFGEARQLVDRIWAEASRLGLVALDTVSSYTGLIGSAEPMAERLAGLFPQPIEEIIVQADLTAVAPGPLTHQVAHDLRLLAQQESRGAGGVFRFSAESLSVAYDAGWSSAQIFEWLSRHSTTGIPQPLAYLVDDVARRHGSVRIGMATSYVQLDDPTDAAALLRHPSADMYRLRELAPGVLAAAAEPEELLELLQELGHRPTIDEDGGWPRTVPTEPRARTTVTRSATPPRSAADAAEMIMAGEATGAAAGELAQATREARPVHVAYVSSDGSPAERVLKPLDLAAGSVRGLDRQSAQMVTIPLSRISAVRPI